MTKIYNSVAEMVGKTPMLKLSKLAKAHKVKSFTIRLFRLKTEWLSK